MSRKSFRIALAIVGGTFAVALAIAGYFAVSAIRYPHQAHPGTGKAVAFEVEPNMGFATVAQRLQAAGIIDDARYFRLYGMYRGATKKVRAGTYQLTDNLTPKQVLNTLLAGAKEKTVAVTLPEGLHMLEYFDILERAGVAKRAELEPLARDAALLRELGIAAPSLEGYLFPDTYDFPLAQPPEVVLRRLVKRYFAVWQEVAEEAGGALEARKAALKRPDGSPWTDHDILIMASLVEKEAVLPSEQARIAQVFYNRLTSASFPSRRLETDPTIRYGCMVGSTSAPSCRQWKTSDRLRTAQLRDAENRYNTYQHAGLPPGPICSPGRGALLAAMKPDGSDYYYFVGRNDGSHVFSKTFAEHDRYVDKFQR